MKEQGTSSKQASETDGLNISDTSEVIEQVEDGAVASASTKSRPQTPKERHEELLEMVRGGRSALATGMILLDIREALVHQCRDSERVLELLEKIAKQGAPKKPGRPRKKPPIKPRARQSLGGGSES